MSINSDQNDLNSQSRSLSHLNGSSQHLQNPISNNMSDTSQHNPNNMQNNYNNDSQANTTSKFSAHLSKQISNNQLLKSIFKEFIGCRVVRGPNW